MHEPSYTSVVSLQSFPAASASYPVHVREIEEEKAVFRAWQRAEKFKRDLLWLASFWPLAGGIGLGLMAPWLGTVLGRSHPWMLWVFFPFSLLAQQPGLPAGLHLAASLPLLLLYAQFPLEGLVARRALRGRVTVSGVAGQVFFMHFLGSLQLVMVSGVVSQVVRL
jgi:hypothetical protein